MKSLKQHFIEYVVEETVKRVPTGRTVRVMDLGCGTASYVPALMEKFPNIEYVGVEPIPTSFTAAEKNLAGIKNVTIHFQLGYDAVPNEKEETFDLVFSLSVLEHVKQLEKFIALGAQYVRPGGMMMHRYDLGHALYPHSLKERLHAMVGNTFPNILPERQFVRYVGETEVRDLFTKVGVNPTHATYHQMPNHKHLEKRLVSSTTAIDELFVWEIEHQAEFRNIPLPDRELLFPAVAVWGEK